MDLRLRWRTLLKHYWADMLEPPWAHSGNDKWVRRHWWRWLLQWAWALSGLVLGALGAPPLVDFAGISNPSYRDWLVVAIAVFAGFAVQLGGWSLFIVTAAVVVGLFEYGDRLHRRLPKLLSWLPAVIFVPFGVALQIIVSLLPPVAIAYGIYLYFTHVGADQRTVTIAFVGGLLVKTFLIPFIKSLVTGAAFKVLMSWLRGGKKKAPTRTTTE